MSDVTKLSLPTSPIVYVHVVNITFEVLELFLKGCDMTAKQGRQFPRYLALQLPS